MTDTVTVEAEYSQPGRESSTTSSWTFDDVTPQEAKDRVAANYVPLTATLWRLGVWHGDKEDRPENGHEDGIFDD